MATPNVIVPFLDADGVKRNLRMLGTYQYLMPMPTPMLVEVKTENDLSDGKVTFSDEVFLIAIDNKDTSNDGVFTVNGTAIRLSPGAAWSGAVGGSLDDDVTVTGSTKFDIQRFI